MSFERIRELIAEIVSCDIDEITMDTNMKEDLGMDSLDAMELVMSIDEELCVTIPDEKVPEMVYVRDLVAYVDEDLGE